MASNFTQALKELTGFDDEKVEASEKISKPVEKQYALIKSVKTEYKPPVDNCTNITSTMVLTGNIKSDDDIYVNGLISGNVETKGDLHAQSTIKGDISAANAVFNGAKVSGNVKLSGELNAGSDVIIVGDIECGDAVIAGKIKGNCDIENTAALKNTSVLLGNIVAKSISTEQGAKINGAVTVKSWTADLDEEFDFGGDL